MLFPHNNTLKKLGTIDSYLIMLVDLKSRRSASRYYHFGVQNKHIHHLRKVVNGERESKTWNRAKNKELLFVIVL